LVNPSGRDMDLALKGCCDVLNLTLSSGHVLPMLFLLGSACRFIREGSLSFASLTHFLPKEFRLQQTDKFILSTYSNVNMPTHGHMLHESAAMMSLLQVLQVPCPDMLQLVTRYVTDLQLPGDN
jgi:hypothetical protein